MSRIFVLTLFLIFYPQLVLARITIENVLGATSYDYELGSNNVVIWAGAAGDDSICSSNSDGTCNNCTGFLATCNERRVDPNGYLTITFRSDSASGVPLFTNDDKQQSIISNSQIQQIINSNNSATLQIPWSNICSRGEGQGAGCQLDERITFHIGIDSSVNGGNGNGNLNDNTDDSLQVDIEIRSVMGDFVSDEGITDFALYPGDEQIHLLIHDSEEDEPDGQDPLLWVSNNFPSYRNIRFQEIRFYYVEGESCSAAGEIANNSNYITTSIVDFQTGSDLLKLDRTSFTHSSDRGNKKFENDITYVFIAALVDQAGNIGFFSRPEDCFERDHVITPSEATGMLEPRCFIATAAYGQSHKMLKTFYQFRYQKLLPYTLGIVIHRLYYTYSPPIAAIIQDNPLLRYIARAALIPFWLYAFLALQIGHVFTLSLLFILLSLPIYFFVKRKLRLL